MTTRRVSLWNTVTQRYSTGIRDTFVKNALRQPPEGAIWLAWGLAALILLVYLTLAVGGVWTVLHALRPFHFWAFALSALLLLVLSLSVPRLGRPPKTLDETQAPELLGLCREVAGALGLKTSVGVRLTWRFNASYGNYGWRHRPVMTLGLPILYGFTPQQRVAIIAHELAHGVNRDPSRGLLLWLAQRFLITLYITLHPGELWQPRMGYMALPGFIGNLLMLGLACIPYGLLWLMAQLIGQDSQRAEYRADLLAAQVAGSQDTAEALDRLHLQHLFEYSLQKQRLSPERPSAFQEFGHQLAVYPPERMQALREKLTAEHLSLDASHPPTDWRVNVVRAHSTAPTVVLDAARAARIEAELKPFVAALQREAADAQRERGG